MRCYRCSTPTATPLVASGRDWGSCGSGWGRPAPLTAWPRSPWSWRGAAGLLGLVRYLRQGGEVALTPDGPREPAERMKPGALAAAQHANAVVIAAGARPSSAWWIESWDRFCLPRPFARVEIRYSAPFGVEAGKEALRRGMTTAEREIGRAHV